MSNSGPKEGATSDGEHTTVWWKDEGDVTHRVSSESDGSREHYTQSHPDGTELVYDYDSGKWIDKSK